MRVSTVLSTTLTFAAYAPYVLCGPAAKPSPSSNRVAIIGAGAGGSSAAYWISLAQQRWGLDIDIDVYEQRSYIGGRKCTVHATCHKVDDLN